MDSITLQHFMPLLGQRFDVQVDPGNAVGTELAEATALPSPAVGAGREAFSLMFKGPPQPVLPQRIYRVAHDGGALAPLDLFIVPVRGSADAIWYEAVFT